MRYYLPRGLLLVYSRTGIVATGVSRRCAEGMFLTNGHNNESNNMVTEEKQNEEMTPEERLVWLRERVSYLMQICFNGSESCSTRQANCST